MKTRKGVNEERGGREADREWKARADLEKVSWVNCPLRRSTSMGFFLGTSFLGTSIYDRHFDEMHSVTLNKH